MTKDFEFMQIRVTPEAKRALEVFLEDEGIALGHLAEALGQQLLEHANSEADENPQVEAEELFDDPAGLLAQARRIQAQRRKRPGGATGKSDT